MVLHYEKNTPIQTSLPLLRNVKSSVSQQRGVKIGVIGAGLFGKALLLPTLQKLREASLHTLASRSGANVEHSGRKFGFLNQTTDEEQIWSNPDIQGVIGLTPHNHHASLVQSALEKQKHPKGRDQKKQGRHFPDKKPCGT